MNLSTSPHREIDWTVTISVHEREGQTQATARLLFGDHESVGVGLSRLSPAEHGFAGLAPPGPEATSSVFMSDLARQLTVTATSDRIGPAER